MSKVITKDYATPALREMHAQLSRGRRRNLLVYCANRVTRQLKRHFREREQSGDSRRARRGWPSRHFWAGVERATQLGEVTDERATINIAHVPFAHKLKGGTIPAKRGTYLAIPLRAEAYAAGSPREWDNANIRSELRLVPIRSKTGKLFLAQVGDGFMSGPLGARGLRVQYLLVRSVTQQADPRALPPQEEIEQEINDAAQEYFVRRILPGKQRQPANEQTS